VGAFSFVTQDTQRLQVTVQGSGTLLSQTITVSAPGNGTTWIPETFSFVADSSTTTLTFRDVSLVTDSVDLTLDNVRVTTAASGSFTNGSFESDFTGWSAAGNVRVIVNGTAGYSVTNGTKAVAFNGGNRTPNGVVAQTFTTTAGQTYSLMFDVGAFSFVTQDAQRLQVTVQGNGTLLSQTITVTAPGNGTTWLPQTFGFTANSGTTTLTFSDVSLVTDNVDLMLDNVRAN
jgi:hypothetical protein